MVDELGEISQGEPPKKLQEKFQSANKDRDFRIYTAAMDAALLAKAQSIFPHFGMVKEGDVIVDAGSGTGALAELAAEEFRTPVYAVDISHELAERAADNRAHTKLVFGDASQKVFPDNSVSVKYYSTSGHEIESFGGSGAMTNAVRATFQELKPGGRIVVRDFAKPSRTEPIYMRILSNVGLDDPERAMQSGYLDYSLLSTRALFLRFHEEFRGGNAFNYEIVTIDGTEYIKLDPEWAHEFYLRKDYTANWRQEIQEKYTYWAPEDAKETLAQAGYVNVEVVPDPNSYIIENRLQGKIGLFEINQEGKLVEVPFPTTHMVVVGTKPQSSTAVPIITSPEELPVAASYQELKKTIHYDAEHHSVTIGERNFALDPEHERATASKKDVFWLEGEPPRVLKVVRTNALNDHSVFKSMFQCVAREHILEEASIPHLRILEADPEGPPYRYFIQEAVPENTPSAATLITENLLTEDDIAQMAEYVNHFELGKEWQLDTNPFNWFRITQDDGTTQMVYVDGKVYRYDESWEFRRVGLLQWLDSTYVQTAVNRSAVIPKEKEYVALKARWDNGDNKNLSLWKKYLHPLVQPHAV